MSIAAQLRDKGIELPQPSKAIANYVPIVRSGNHLIVSGQLCFDAKGELYKGKLGAEVTLEQGQFAARCCGLNLLAQVATELPDLESIKRVVRLGGFVNASPDFIQISAVMNGASDLMVELFGDRGKHARSTIGVASLPLDAAVELEGTFEI